MLKIFASPLAFGLLASGTEAHLACLLQTFLMHLYSALATWPMGARPQRLYSFPYFNLNSFEASVNLQVAAVGSFVPPLTDRSVD